MSLHDPRSALDSLWLAQSLFKRGHYDECVDLCSSLLNKNDLDTAAWFLKCRALTSKTWIDDADIEEETAGDALIDAHATAKNPRPGPSFNRPGTSKDSIATAAQGVRPMTRSGRPPTGFARPGTANRPASSRRPATASVRPGTAGVVRLATSSTRQELATDVFFRIGAADAIEFAKNPACSRALCDYYLYNAQDPQKAFELCSAVMKNGELSWWWLARLGKCCYQLGMLQEAEAYLRRSFERQPIAATALDLAKIYIRQDQPNGALATYDACLKVVRSDTDCLLGRARICEMMNEEDEAAQIFKQVLKLDGSNVESHACLAAHYFYSGEPDVALRHYRRLVLMGIHNAEVWNNLGLCCLYTSRYDLCVHCFNQALRLSTDAIAADIWYNIGNAALAVGELDMAEQAFSTAAHLDNTHSEAMNNIGVMHKQSGKDASARLYYDKARAANKEIFEAWYNSAIDSMENEDLQSAHKFIMTALDVCPEHEKSKQLHNSILKDLSRN